MTLHHYSKRHKSLSAEVSDFFNSLGFGWQPIYAEKTTCEARLKAEGRWHAAPLDKKLWLNTYPEDVKEYSTEEYERFLNDCPVDDVRVCKPQRKEPLSSDPVVAARSVGGPTWRDLNEEESQLIAYKDSYITLEGPSASTTYLAPNGKDFTVRQLFDVVADHVRRAMRVLIASGELSKEVYPHHEFKGLKRIDTGVFCVQYETMD